jgi:hypothetical protein
MVEAQHKVSTAKLTDNLTEQAVLESLIDSAKPGVPEECRRLHYLLSTPFRYGAAYPRGSRFRRAGVTPGVFYGSEISEVAATEMVFYRLLFYAESPSTPWPTSGGQYTAFSAEFRAEKSIDLCMPPFDGLKAVWMHPTDYDGCQELAELARSAAVDLIRYHSVRDSHGRQNLAILSCRAFSGIEPKSSETWQIHLSASGARAFREFPRLALNFNRTAFAADPRIAAMPWDR